VNWLKNKPGRNKVESLKVFKQVIKGLSFIHKKGLVHRDIKPGNILFAKTTEDLRIRIADFGLSKHVGSFTVTAGGTMLYMTPEMISGQFDQKSDIYSAGLILLELLYNCSGDLQNILNNAKRNQFPPPFESTMKFAVPTLKKMLSFNVSDRPTSEELLQFLNTNPDWVRCRD
jgi:serine/threonine protein kinase